MLDHLAAITVKHLWLETESLLLLLPAVNSVTIIFASFFTPRCQRYLAKIILLGWISSTTSLDTEVTVISPTILKYWDLSEKLRSYILDYILKGIAKSNEINYEISIVRLVLVRDLIFFFFHFFPFAIIITAASYKCNEPPCYLWWRGHRNWFIILIYDFVLCKIQVQP